jgi:hypothetical protein
MVPFDNPECAHVWYSREWLAMRKAQIKMTQPSPALTVELAAQLARIALNGIAREYPTYPDHILLDAADLRGARELHPAFYGCFDWHSAVHSHWLLARLLPGCLPCPRPGQSAAR